ncbi:TPA: type-F conjugative transfer system pilin assembly protein TrbC [Vibrio cholerae]
MKVKVICLSLIVSSSLSYANENQNELLNRLDKLSEVENYQPDMNLIQGVKEPTLSNEDRKIVDKVKSQYEDPKFKKQIDQWQKTLSKQMGAKSWKSIDELEVNQTIPFSDKPILFISSSMPMHVLNRYAHDLEKINGVMVLRGGIGGLKKVMPTLQFIADVLKKNPSCKSEPCEKYAVEVIIDPILFTEYQIDRVPAFTVHGKENFTAYCNQTEPLNKGKKVSFGDYTIKYHLQNIQRNNEYKSAIEML